MDSCISIIVPIYNVEQYLRECVDSILAQSYQNLEIILVDDGSPDRCGAICDEYAAADPRIKVIHKVNGGLSDARNAGLEVATGDYIGFVDSDDWIAPDMFSYLLKGLEEKPSESWLEMLEEHGASQSLEDCQLLALRNEGYTHAEIAVIAGFSSHSGVIGRFKQIVGYCKDETPLKPRRNGKRGSGFYSRSVGSIPRRQGSARKVRLSIGNGFSLCRYCLRKEKPERCDDRRRVYKQGTICAASDLTRVCRLHSRPRKKRACRSEQKQC